MPASKYIAGWIALLVILLLETASPLFMGRGRRWRHAKRNLSIILINTGVLLFLFSPVTASVFAFLGRSGWGLFNSASLPSTLRLILIIVSFDLWMYVWHRLNHEIPFLWLFHRMHHGDPQMDVTTALRFHFGEVLISAMLRWSIFVLLGMGLPELLLYETVMFPVIFLHHSNFYLPRWIDRILRTVIVTPWMHWVHHSMGRAEMNSNYGTILS